MSYERVMASEELWEGDMARVDVASTPVLLVRLEGAVRAYVDRCPHQRVALSHGRLEGCVLTCGAHGWAYDACSGEGINPAAARLARVAVEERSGGIWIDASGGGPHG